MFTLTKIYAQATSRVAGTHAENGSAAFADALDSYEYGRYELDGSYVSCSQVETYLSNDGLHGYTKTENLSTIIEIE